jgi:hypothetical protein
MFRREIRSARDVYHGVDDFLVLPVRWEFGLTRDASAMPMSTATVFVAVEYVRGPLIAHANVFRGRPIRDIYRIPARTIRPRIGSLSRPAVRSAERLVVLLVTTSLGGIRSRGRIIANRNLPLGLGEIVVGSV